MKKILIVSDTHGRLDNLQRVLELQGHIDYLFHLGDSEGQQQQIAEMAGCPVEIVKGNCDFGQDLPYDKMVHVGSHSVFLTHGHRYQVFYGPETLMEAAKSRGAQVAVYGHTHVPLIRHGQGITVLNPGSLTSPRQSGFAYTYILMELDNSDEIHYTLCELKKKN